MHNAHHPFITNPQPHPLFFLNSAQNPLFPPFSPAAPCSPTGTPGTGLSAASLFALSMAAKSNGTSHRSIGISPSFVLPEAKVYMDGVKRSVLRLTSGMCSGEWEGRGRCAKLAGRSGEDTSLAASWRYLVGLRGIGGSGWPAVAWRGLWGPE